MTAKASTTSPLLDKAGELVRTVTAAKEALDALRSSRRENALAMPGRKPTFEAFADEYLAMATTRAKRSGTQENETQAISRWRACGLIGSRRRF